MVFKADSAFSTKETPWGGLGVKLDKAATSEEAIKAAGLDWEIEMRQVLARAGGGRMQVVPGYFATTRKTDNKVFGIMKDKFRPVQNKEAFNFFDEVVGEKLAIYHTAGSLKGGKIVWIMAEIPGTMEILGDQIDKFILLLNPHDGSGALQICFTPIRFVCTNIITNAFNRAQLKFHSRHTRNVLNRVSMARETLQIADKFYIDWKKEAEELSRVQITSEKRAKLLKMAYTGDPDKKDDEIWRPIRAAMDQADQLITSGRGQDNPKIAGTAWQAYNGIVEQVDYFRGTKKTTDQRLTSSLLGSGEIIKERSWNYLLQN